MIISFVSIYKLFVKSLKKLLKCRFGAIFPDILPSILDNLHENDLQATL